MSGDHDDNSNLASQEPQTEGDQIDLPDRILMRKSQLWTGSSESDPDPIIELPKVIDSHFTLQFLGFTPETSSSIWNRWVDLPLDVQEFGGFKDFVLGYLETKAVDTSLHQEDYRAVFQAYGFGNTLIEGLMDPVFEALRLTKSAFWWADDVVRKRFFFLEQVALKAWQQDHRSGSNAAGIPSITSASGAGKTFPAVGREPDTTQFWHGTTLSLALRAKESTLIPDYIDDYVNLSSLCQCGPGAFSCAGGYYFTPQVAGAQFYARYYRRLLPEQQTTLVCLNIPNSLLEGINQPYILDYPSEAFKQVVWYSRRGYNYRRHQPGVAAATLLIGDVAKWDKYQQVKHWSDINEAHLLKLADGSRMRQAYFEDDFHGLLSSELPPENVTLHREHDPSKEDTRKIAGNLPEISYS